MRSTFQDRTTFGCCGLSIQPNCNKVREPLGWDTLPFEINEAALDVGVDESHAHGVADVGALRSSNESAFSGRLEDADPSSLGRGSCDDAFEVIADS